MRAAVEPPAGPGSDVENQAPSAAPTTPRSGSSLSTVTRDLTSTNITADVTPRMHSENTTAKFQKRLFAARTRAQAPRETGPKNGQEKGRRRGPSIISQVFRAPSSVCHHSQKTTTHARPRRARPMELEGWRSRLRRAAKQAALPLRIRCRRPRCLGSLLQALAVFICQSRPGGPLQVQPRAR